MKPYHDHLKRLHSQVKSLTENSLALDAIFTEEGTKLSWEDEASSLTELYRGTIEQLQRLEMIEASASIGYSKANLILSLSGAALTAVLSKGNRLPAITDYLRRSPIGKQPFGLVMVSIGPKGLPDDVRVIAISQLARESNRPEYAVIQELREQGYLLYNETDFSLLIDRVVSDIREGRLRLPVSIEKLSSSKASKNLQFIPVKTKLP